MDFLKACRVFNVKTTNRQRIKWGRHFGRAYKLAQALGHTVEEREVANTAAELFNYRNADDIEDEDSEIEEMPVIKLVENYEIRRVLGQ